MKKPPPPGGGPTTQSRDTNLPTKIQKTDGSAVTLIFDTKTKDDGLTGDQLVTKKLADTLTDILSETKDISSVNVSATTNGHKGEIGDHAYGDAVDISRINGVPVAETGLGIAYAYELQIIAMAHPNVRYVEGPIGNYARQNSNSTFARSKLLHPSDLNHVHISVFPEQ